MKKKQSGFTLVEMLVVISLIALIVGAAAVSIFTLMKSTGISNDQATALRQVQNTGFWISRDVLMAKKDSVDGDGSGGVFLSLQYYDWNGSTFDSTPTLVEYVFDGDKLHRNVSGDLPDTLIAEYIDVDSTTIVSDGTNKWKLTVQASHGRATVQRVYEVKQRPER